jgi:hypothetical protein
MLQYWTKLDKFWLVLYLGIVNLIQQAKLGCLRKAALSFNHFKASEVCVASLSKFTIKNVNLLVFPPLS